MRARFLACLWTALVAAMPGLATAQHWATRDLCDLSAVRQDPSQFVDDVLRDLVAETATTPNAIGTFWTITAAGGATSHLWGTSHSNDPLYLDLPAVVLDTVRQARIAAFEIDPVAPTRRAVVANAQPNDMFAMRPGLLARLNLPDDLVSWLGSRTADIGWGPDAADFLSPGGLAELLLYDPCNDFGAAVYPIQDSWLQTHAAISGVEVIGLENLHRFRRHLNKSANFGLARDIILLYGASLDPDQTNHDRQIYAVLYQYGLHAAALAYEARALRAQYGAERGQVLQRSVDSYMLDERNRIFLDRLAPELPVGDVFIAVGAAHLPGENGLVAMLRRSGYGVERVRLDREWKAGAP